MRFTTSRRFSAAALALAAALCQGGPRAAHAGEATPAPEVVDYDAYVSVVREVQDGAEKQKELVEKKKKLREQKRQADELAAAVDEADPALRAAFAGQLLDLQAEIDSIEHDLALGDLDLRVALAEQAHLAALLTLDACEDDPVDPKP